MKITPTDEVGSEESLYGDEYEPCGELTIRNKKRKSKSKSDEFKENEVVKECDLGKNTLVVNALGIDGKVIPYNPLEVVLDSINKRGSVLISEDTDFYILFKLNEDRLKSSSNISDTKLSFITDKLVHITCYGFDKDISETCIDRFSRIYTCKSSIVDNALIEKGLEILEKIINHSGFSKYMSVLLEIKDVVKFNQSVDFDMKVITGGTSNCSKTFNMYEITKSKVKDIAYRTGISDSSVTYICCILALTFSRNTVSNIRWFNNNYVIGEHNFAKSKVLKWFISQKGVLKRTLDISIMNIFKDYLAVYSNINVEKINGSDVQDIVYCVRLYNILKKLQILKMVDSDIKLKLSTHRNNINILRKFLKSIKNEVSNNYEEKKSI